MVSADAVLAALADLDVHSAGVDLNGQILAAQKQAGTRCKPRRLERSNRVALEAARQHAAELGVPGVGFRRGGEKPSLAAAGLMGRWMDSYGNMVSVYSTDAYEMRPMATLMKESRPDVHLRLVPANGGWRCGEAVLDVQQSSVSQVRWVFPDGRESFWTRWQEGCEYPEAATCSKPQPYFMLMPIGVVQTAC
mmetsp:Transcript_31651/g.62177  ORF Transcript_31651/g.62177 Transcript_31651/m.62177 type:complete len:193 (-) Transcript_31651:159-737(-)